MPCRRNLKQGEIGTRNPGPGQVLSGPALAAGKTIEVIMTWSGEGTIHSIGIDHVLPSREVRVEALRALPVVGSDHRGLLAVLRW